MYVGRGPEGLRTLNWLCSVRMGIPSTLKLTQTGINAGDVYIMQGKQMHFMYWVQQTNHLHVIKQAVKGFNDTAM